jgi:hypothetical protein
MRTVAGDEDNWLISAQRRRGAPLAIIAKAIVVCNQAIAQRLCGHEAQS